MQKSTLIFIMAVTILMTLNLPEVQARMTLQQLRNAMKGMGKTCAAKNGVAPEIMAQTKKGEFPVDKPLQCYFLCLFVQMKIAKEGKIVIDVMNKQIDMMMPLDILARSKEVAQQCYEQSTSEDDCERSWQFTKCYYETDSSIYFFP